MGMYDDLDKKLIKAIDDGYNTFGRFSGRMASTDWRLIDRRLQALRKAGAIEYVDRYWRVAKK